MSEPHEKYIEQCITLGLIAKTNNHSPVGSIVVKKEDTFYKLINGNVASAS